MKTPSGGMPALRPEALARPAKPPVARVAPVVSRARAAGGTGEIARRPTVSAPTSPRPWLLRIVGRVAWLFAWVEARTSLRPGDPDRRP